MVILCILKNSWFYPKLQYDYKYDYGVHKCEPTGIASKLDDTPSMSPHVENIAKCAVATSTLDARRKSQWLIKCICVYIEAKERNENASENGLCCS